MKEVVSFTSQKNDNLSGLLHIPDIAVTKAYAIFAHCFTCTKSMLVGELIAGVLAEEGIATLRFDFTGLGASKGQFSDSSFSTNIDDLESAAAFLAEQYETPQILIGHSLGGTAALAVAQRLPSVKAIVTIGSPASPKHVLHLFGNQLDGLNEHETIDVSLGGHRFKFRQAFVDDVNNQTLDIGGLGKALMVLHAPHDGIVSIDEAGKIFSAAKHPKSFVTLDSSDHLLSNAADSKYVGGLIANWVKRYLTSSNQVLPADLDKRVVVAAKTADGFFNVVSAGEHRFIADEPTSYGGTNRGPTPYDLLGAALGSCTSMTLNGYARRKAWNLERVTVAVSHERVHAQDCEDCLKTDGKVDQFTRIITLQGDLSEEERHRLLEIADRCPVHKTLENEIHVVTQLQEKLL